MHHVRSRSFAALCLVTLAVSCGEDAPPGSAPEPGGAAGSGGSGGGRVGAGAAGSGGGVAGGATAGAGGAGGTAGAADAGGTAGPRDAGGAPPGGDAALPAGDSGAAATGAPLPANLGRVGELVLLPLQHTATPVPPIIAPECPDDPTQGFAEYEDSFVVQRPRNLAAADRFKYENGIYTFSVQSSDQPHKPNNGTAPRTEARYSDISTGEHIWSADVMFEAPSKTCVMQIHNVVGAIGVYLRVQGNRMFNLPTGKTILTDYTGKWFNLKVAFNTQTLEIRTYVNNCLKETSRAPRGMPFWYYKHGVYTCDSGTCRSNYKNVHLYQKGSTDRFNTLSTFP